MHIVYVTCLSCFTKKRKAVASRHIASARFLINFYGLLSVTPSATRNVSHNSCSSDGFKCTLEFCITYLRGRTTAPPFTSIHKIRSLMIAFHRNRCNRFSVIHGAFVVSRWWLLVPSGFVTFFAFFPFFSPLSFVSFLFLSSLFFFVERKKKWIAFLALFAFPSTSFALVKLNGWIINPLKRYVIVIKFTKNGWFCCCLKWIFQRCRFCCGRTIKKNNHQILNENTLLIFRTKLWSCLIQKLLQMPAVQIC